MNTQLAHNKKLVLLVEDDLSSIHLQRKLIERAGGTLHVEQTVGGALEFLKSNEPDLVLTDLSFPEEQLSGIDFLLQVKKLHSPIIVVSGRGEEATRTDVARLGAKAFLSKPFAVGQYSRMIENGLGTQATAKKAAPSAAKPAEAPHAEVGFEKSLASLDVYLLTSVSVTILLAAYHSVLELSFRHGNWFLPF